MALRAVVEKLEDILEPVREHYRQDGDRYILDVEAADGFALDDVQTIKSNLRKEREQSKRSKSLLEKLGFKWGDESKSWEGGIDPKEYEESLERLHELEAIDPDKEADRMAEQKFKALETQLKDRHGRELENEKANTTRYREALRREMVDLRATNAIREKQGVVDILLPKVKSVADLMEVEDGELVPIVRGKDGEPRITTRTGSTGWMTFDEYLDELKADAAWQVAFEGRGKSGGGTSSTGTRQTSASIAGKIPLSQMGSHLDKVASGELEVVPDE